MNRIAKLACVYALVSWNSAAIGCLVGDVPDPVEVLDYNASLHKEQNDREALIALYQATGGESWTRNDGWVSSAPLDEWHGVKVSLGRVRSLNLSNNNLSGHLPPELLRLTSLRSLDLRWNSLSGQLPDFSKLKRVKELLLTDNQFIGEIPEWIGNIRRLERLDLSHNQFVGVIPKELGALDKLQALALHHNNLEGTLPAELGGLESLRRLILNNNELTGSIPEELKELKSLRHLNLSNNRITGLVPQWASSTKLEWVDLRGNPIESNTEIFRIALPEYSEFWAHPDENHPDNNVAGSPMGAGTQESIATEMWAQTSEVIESPKVRSFVFESLRRLEIREGHVYLNLEYVPEYIRVGNIHGVLETLNSHLKDTDIKVTNSNELERSFEAVEGRTPGRETVDPFATNEPLERWHEDGVLPDGTIIHVDGIVITGIRAVSKKLREDRDAHNTDSN